MTTTIERITAIIDEATADERAKVLDLERRLSNAYADLVSKDAALAEAGNSLHLMRAKRDEMARERNDLTVENNQQRAEVTHLGKLNAEQDEQIRALRDMLARATPATDDAALIVALRKDKADLKETIAALNIDRDNLMAEVAKRDATIAALQVQRITANQQAIAAENKLKRQHANEPVHAPEPSQEVADLAAKVQDLRDANARDAARLRREIGRKERRIGGMIKELRRRDTVITELNKQIDDAHAENARLVLRAAEIEAREERNIVDMQATIRTLSERSTLAMAMHANHVGAMTGAAVLPTADEIRAAANKAMQALQASMNTGRTIQAISTTIDEQGPWVVYDPEREYGLPYRLEECWVTAEELDDVAPFRDAGRARNCIRDLGIERYRVITLAEARAIEAQKTSG